MSGNTVRIENHTDQLIDLPPIAGYELERADGSYELVDFPRGVRLVPGLTTVPVLYLDALRAQSRPVFDQLGRPRTERKTGNALIRYPGREALAILVAPVTYTTANGRKFGPRVTIYEPDQVIDRPDGPPAPATLPASPQAAMTIVSVTDDKKALERWMKQTKDANVKVAIQSRLAALKAGSSGEAA